MQLELVFIIKSCTAMLSVIQLNCACIKGNYNIFTVCSAVDRRINSRRVGILEETASRPCIKITSSTPCMLKFEVKVQKRHKCVKSKYHEN